MKGSSDKVQFIEFIPTDARGSGGSHVRFPRRQRQAEFADATFAADAAAAAASAGTRGGSGGDRRSIWRKRGAATISGTAAAAAAVAAAHAGTDATARVVSRISMATRRHGSQPGMDPNAQPDRRHSTASVATYSHRRLQPRRHAGNPAAYRECQHRRQWGLQ